LIQAAEGRLQAGQPLPADAGAAAPEQPPEALGLVPGAWGREQARAGHEQQGRQGWDGLALGRRKLEWGMGRHNGQ
jgi:hypothetical protein